MERRALSLTSIYHQILPESLDSGTALTADCSCMKLICLKTLPPRPGGALVAAIFSIFGTLIGRSHPNLSRISRGYFRIDAQLLLRILQGKIRGSTSGSIPRNDEMTLVVNSRMDMNFSTDLALVWVG